MGLHRGWTALVLGMAAGGACAQQDGLRWPGQGLRSLELRLAGMEQPVSEPFARRSSGLGISLVSKAGMTEDLGIYGRMGSASRLSSIARFGSPEGTGLTYGVGLSWDFSPRASATLGWDAYDFRGVMGEREMRATSLGLQWRY